MKKMHRTNAGSLFLMELILAILLFALCSAVCVQLFVSAHRMSQRASALTVFVREASSITELCRASGDAQEATDRLSEAYPAGAWEKDTFILYYNTAWEVCEKEDALYSLSVSVVPEGQLYTSQVTVQHARDGLLYELPATHPSARRWNDGN